MHQSPMMPRGMTRPFAPRLQCAAIALRPNRGRAQVTQVSSKTPSGCRGVQPPPPSPKFTHATRETSGWGRKYVGLGGGTTRICTRHPRPRHTERPDARSERPDARGQKREARGERREARSGGPLVPCSGSAPTGESARRRICVLACTLYT